MIRRHVFTLDLKDDDGIVETYTRSHRDVWPEVQASLRQVGVERMDIYLLGRRLVMVVDMRDGIDYRSAFQSHAASSPRVAEWERRMTALQQPAAGARAGEWWAAMEPVFHLDADGGPAGSLRRPGATEHQESGIAHLADRPRTS